MIHDVTPKNSYWAEKVRNQRSRALTWCTRRQISVRIFYVFTDLDKHCGPTTIWPDFGRQVLRFFIKIDLSGLAVRDYGLILWESGARRPRMPMKTPI